MFYGHLMPSTVSPEHSPHGQSIQLPRSNSPGMVYQQMGAHVQPRLRPGSFSTGGAGFQPPGDRMPFPNSHTALLTA